MRFILGEDLGRTNVYAYYLIIKTGFVLIISINPDSEIDIRKNKCNKLIDDT